MAGLVKHSCLHLYFPVPFILSFQVVSVANRAKPSPIYTTAKIIRVTTTSTILVGIFCFKMVSSVIFHPESNGAIAKSREQQQPSQIAEVAIKPQTIKHKLAPLTLLFWSYHNANSTMELRMFSYPQNNFNTGVLPSSDLSTSSAKLNLSIYPSVPAANIVRTNSTTLHQRPNAPPTPQRSTHAPALQRSSTPTLPKSSSASTLHQRSHCQTWLRVESSSNPTRTRLEKDESTKSSTRSCGRELELDSDSTRTRLRLDSRTQELTVTALL